MTRREARPSPPLICGAFSQLAPSPPPTLGKRRIGFRPGVDFQRPAMMRLIVSVEASLRKQICGSMPENDSVNMSRYPR